MSENSKKSNNTVFSFASKLVIALIFLYTIFALSDFSDIQKFVSSKIKTISVKINEKQNQFYLLGLVQNPAALYRSSEIHENMGHLDNAIRDMDLAVGLLEMHGANQTVIERYVKRISALKKQVDKK